MVKASAPTGNNWFLIVHNPLSESVRINADLVCADGRMSRLMMNFVLKSKGYPMLNIPYEGRNSYYGALERAQIGKMDDIFVSWFMRRYVKAHNTYLYHS